MRYRQIITEERVQRVHLTKRPGFQLKPRSYPQQVGRKPNGFWWGMGSAWADFINQTPSKARGIKARKGGVPQEVVIDEASCKLLQLTDWPHILAFTIKYGRTLADNGRFFWQDGNQNRYDPNQDKDLKPRNYCRVAQISWPDVARDYDAIEIPNYKKRDPDRPFVEWLDIDWDVPSGCAWNLKGVSIDHEVPAVSPAATPMMPRVIRDIPDAVPDASPGKLISDIAQAAYGRNPDRMRIMRLVHQLFKTALASGRDSQVFKTAISNIKNMQVALGDKVPELHSLDLSSFTD